MKLSHILYKSNSLSKSVKKFQDEGFEVEYGSKHNPKNALIYFSEGPYIEILEKAPISNFLMMILRLIGKAHLVDRFKSWENAHEGYFDICLENYKNDFKKEVEILNEHKEHYFITKSSRLDPSNRLLWQMNRRRLDFEAMRDSVLAVSGNLNLRQRGRSEKIENKPNANRRTIYGFIDRQNLPSLFRTFDFAGPDTTCGRRFTTTIPQQSLYLLNSPFYFLIKT